MDQLTNYGSEEEPLYLKSEICKVCHIPRKTFDDSCKSIKNHLVEKEINIKCVRRGNTYDQKKAAILITKYGLIKILCKIRRSVPRHVLDSFEINELNRFQCAESKWISAIHTMYPKEEIYLQYNVMKYRIDAYLPKYNIVIECDEYNHSRYNQYKKLERCIALNYILRNPKYIRFDPYDESTDIILILRRIHDIIVEFYKK
jgi:very-short-patch-repair endonuclease